MFNVHVRFASFKGYKLKEKGPNHRYSMGVTSSIPQENGFQFYLEMTKWPFHLTLKAATRIIQGGLGNKMSSMCEQCCVAPF